MSEAASFEELKPVLNPEYWGGHSLGYGEPTDEPAARGISALMPRPIRRMFKERIAAMERIVPLETLHAGQVFEDYPEGTVVMFREEKLGGSRQLDLDMETLKEQPVPERPTDFELSLGIKSNRTKLIQINSYGDDDHVVYADAVYCGMVSRNRQNEPVTYAAVAPLITRWGGGKVSVMSPCHSYKMPLKIGETMHIKREKSESLYRVNLLEVVAYGERERQKQKSKGLLGRLAFRHQAI